MWHNDIGITRCWAQAGVIIYRYQTEDISLAKAAHLADVSFDRMKALLHQREVQLRFGPVDEAEIQEEIAALETVIA